MNNGKTGPDRKKTIHNADIINGPNGTSLEVFVNKLNVAYGKARKVDRINTINP